MFRVNPLNRAVLAGAAFASFAGSFVTTPLTARGDTRTVVGSFAAPRPFATPAGFAAILPRRDPFAGDPPPRRNDGARASAIPISAPPFPASSSTAANAAIPAGLAPLPPNAGATGTPLSIAHAGAPAASAAQPSETVRVTAIVTGAHPYALVDDGPTARLVTVGDRIGDDTVAAISAGGIRLAHGATVPLAPAATALRPPSGGHQQ